MREVETIIVGGGPAGAACAWKLRQVGREVLVLDRAAFPRLKPCAGWITPLVLRELQFKPADYPHSLMTFKRLHFRIRGRRIPVPTRQYSIRRTEFDAWLLERAGALVVQHRVRHIRRENGQFVIDDQFRCTYLVGAGGTHCPVYHTFFKELNPRAKERVISTLELEFPYSWHDANCYLWFFDHDLPGYSWYVPKGNGYLNIGIGGKQFVMKARGETIRQHWERFAEKLQRLGLVQNGALEPYGYTYSLRSEVAVAQKGNAFIVGDAAGLATLDMGEGIGPAVQSGLRAAEAILTGRPLNLKGIPKYSFWQILFPFWK
ncbi:MAG: NAD(P)/FAD-dependent oxidoreductase [candidate division KSB1 bacterium]|nr:NAD(P)/FAD-dependent oxidoreductase [candidate division KSB1 bacterium]MDQ7065394.1 NAD(P)/FAD-dependent oxidoreductase [candidate division KSB1 bacterium]